MLHGVRESEDKNANDVIMKTVKEDMYIDMREEDLDRPHRVGNTKVMKNGYQIRPNYQIYSLWYKNTVYKNKKSLKGKNFLVIESLSATRVLLKEA